MIAAKSRCAVESPGRVHQKRRLGTAAVMTVGKGMQNSQRALPGQAIDDAATGAIRAAVRAVVAAVGGGSVDGAVRIENQFARRKAAVLSAAERIDHAFISPGGKPEYDAAIIRAALSGRAVVDARLLLG